MTTQLFKDNRNLSAIILAIGLIIAALIFAYSTRYEYDPGVYGGVVDKWTATIREITRAK
jgi:ABC-type cobalt transport system substrate-binding protein